MQTSSSDTSIWEYVHCSVCMVLFLPPNRPDPAPDIPFWLTECGHVICNNHLKADQSCAACGTKSVSIVPLQRNMSAPLSGWFIPVAESHENLATASRFQHNTLISLIRHYRQRYDSAKIVIKQLQTELTTLRGQQAAQGYPAPSPRLEQRQILESGYDSTTSSGSKRRRLDAETAGHAVRSSPHSITTPQRPTRPMGNENAASSYRNNGMARNMQYSNQAAEYDSDAKNRQPGSRSFNLQQYAHRSPSTPLKHGQISGGPRLAATNQQPRPQSAGVMPPPPVDPRRYGGTPNGRAAGTGLSAGGTNVGSGRFTTQGFEREVGASGSRAGVFGVREGRRFMPGTPMPGR